MTIQILEQLEEAFIENADGKLLFELADTTCSVCQGHGVIESVDYVPYGSASVPMDSSEVCDCIWDAEGLPVLAIAQLVKDNLNQNQIQMLIENLIKVVTFEK